MGLISNEIDKSMLKQGDHVYCYRKAHTYSHHGIYVEENRVIHFTRTRPSRSKRQRCGICGYQPQMDRGVVKSCLDCFLKGSRLFLFEYNVSSNHFIIKKSGTCSTESHDTAEVVIRRANEMLNGRVDFGKYNLFEKNCECFAIYCMTGDSTTSLQALTAKNLVKSICNIVVKPKIETLRIHRHRLAHNHICNDTPSTSSIKQMPKNDNECEDSKEKDTDNL